MFHCPCLITHTLLLHLHLFITVSCQQQQKQQVIFARESSYCFQHVLAIAILSVCPSVRLFVRHTGGSIKNGAR